MQDNLGMNNIHIVAFTHRSLPVGEIGELHIAEENQKERLTKVKQELDLHELMFLSTCNRVEFIVGTNSVFDHSKLEAFLKRLYPNFEFERIHRYVENAEIYQALGAVKGGVISGFHDCGGKRNYHSSS